MVGSQQRGSAEALAEENRTLRRRLAELEAGQEARARALSCLYGLGELAETPGITIEGILEGVAELLPPATRFPNNAAARIEFEGQEFISPEGIDFCSAHSVPIMIHGRGVGRVEVGYAAPVQHTNNTTSDSFPRDERVLLLAVGRRLGRIIERMRASEILRDQQAVLSDILEVTLSGYWDWHIPGNTEYLSPAFKRMFGYEEHELANVTGAWQRLILENDLPKVLEVFDRHVRSRGKEPFHNEVRFQHRDGSTVWVIFVGRVIEWDPDGSPVRMVGCLVDITDRKLAEQELRQSEDRFRDVANAHAGMVWEVDEDFVVTHLSGRVQEILGYEPEEVTGRPPEFIIDAADRERIAEIMARLVTELEPIRDVEYWCRTKDGHRVRLQSSGVAVHTTDGRFLGARGTHLDVTEAYWARRRMEIQLQVHELSTDGDREIARVLCEACAEQADSPLSFFSLVEPDLTVMVTHFWSPDDMTACGIADEPKRIPLDGVGLWAEPVRRREAVVVNDFEELPERRSLPDGHVPLVRFLGVPILKDDRVIAVAGVANKQTLYDKGDVARLQALSTSTADFLATRRAEREVRESERLFHTFIDFTADWEYWLLPDGRHLYDSPSCERITGYGPAEFQSDPELAAKIVHPDDRKRFAEHACERGDRSPRKLELEFRILGKDGELRWIQHLCRPVFKDDGAFAGTRVSNRDITDRKQAEGALQESEVRFRLIAESSPDSIWSMDPDLRFSYLSPSTESLFGYTVQEWDGLSWSQFVSSDHLHRVVEIFEDLKAGHTGSSATAVVKVRHKDGRPMWVEFTASAIRGPGGALQRIVGITRDITERKQAEEERERLQAQLTQAQKMDLVGRLAGGVAHDFNNMIGVILGHVEMAMDKVDPAQPLHGNLTEILKAAERSADLTGQLLAFARQQTAAPKVLDLNLTVEGMLTMLRRLLGEAIEVVWVPGEDAGRIKLDPSQLDQILVNLCVNARDAIEDVGTITIETRAATLGEETGSRHAGLASGDYVVLVVSDDGGGMDEATQASIFEPFFTTKMSGKGTGLGLATVYGIVRQNDGSIEVESAPGRGTRFTIYLPRHVGTLTQESGDTLPAITPMHGRETILLVEDEPGLLRMTTLMLERQGYVVLPASTPGEAMRLAADKTRRIDLLITDVVMPEMNGRDLAKNLLRLDPRLKRLFTSGYTADVIAHHGVLDPGVHFIQKPFTSKRLAAVVRQALENE